MVGYVQSRQMNDDTPHAIDNPEGSAARPVPGVQSFSDANAAIGCYVTLLLLGAARRVWVGVVLVGHTAADLCS